VIKYNSQNEKNANKMNSCISGAVYTALKYSKQGGPENLDFFV